MTDSTRPDSGRKSKKPSKPRPDFPLYPHAAGVWAKKVAGKTCYFGKTADDPNGVAALERWNKEKEDLLAGRKPREDSDALTIESLAFQFLAHKEQLRDHGELNPRTYQGYLATCKTVAEVFSRNRPVTDLVPADFRKLREKLAKTRGVVALRNEMQRVRSIFKFGLDEQLIDKPVVFGQSFAKPKLDAVRREREAHRAEHGDRMFEAADLKAILAAAGQPLRAMILLGINCAFGQSDLSSLPLRAVDRNAGWADFPRPKTAVARKCALWPETVAAISEWLAVRPAAKDQADAGLMFLTCRGQRWVKLNANGTPADALGGEFAKILRKLGLKRPGLSFYGLRHGFETIASETTDQVAVDLVMGHVPRGMGAAYRERIGNDRLVAVSEHVRRWLFGSTETPEPKAKPKPNRQRKPRASKPSDPGEHPKLRLFIA